MAASAGWVRLTPRSHACLCSQRNAGLPLEPPVVNNYRVKDSEGGEEAPSEEEFEEVRSPAAITLASALSFPARGGGRRSAPAVLPPMTACELAPSLACPLPQDLEEEVVDREALKKQSGSILDKATKKTKKRRNKKSA